jgi:cell division ATPase FtsA
MLFSSSQNELMLIIDVQSSVVRGSLVHMHAGAIPTILYTHNVSIPYKPDGGSGYLIKMALRGVEEIVQAVRANLQSEVNASELPHRISSVHFVLSSPWTVSQAKTISTSFKEDTAVSRAYVSGIIWEERSKMTSSAADDIRVIEEKVFDVRLNGYSVASWESRHTKELGVSFVVSIAGGRMIDKFIESVESIVRHKDHIQFHSSLFLQHLSIQKIVPNVSDYALIHIHGELTDVAIIHAHSCSFFGSYPFGVQHIIRSIAKETNTSDDAAESTLNLVMKKDIDATQAKKESAAIVNMQQGWTGEFKKLLKTSSTPEAVPAKVIISARTHEDFFVESFKTAYPQSSPEILDIDQITPYVSYGTHAERLRLTGLYVLAVHSLVK